MKANPCAEVKSVKRPKTKGFPEWTDEDVAKFIERWPLGTQQYVALAIHLYTGLRRGDAVRLGQQRFGQDGKIHIQAEKNKLDLHRPVHPKLVEAIQARHRRTCPSWRRAGAGPWGSKEAYGNEFLTCTKAAGIRQIDTGRTKNSQGIDKLAATRVAEAGASEFESMELFGWTDPAICRRSPRERRTACERKLPTPWLGCGQENGKANDFNVGLSNWCGQEDSNLHSG